MNDSFFHAPVIKKPSHESRLQLDSHKGFHGHSILLYAIADCNSTMTVFLIGSTRIRLNSLGIV